MGMLKMRRKTSELTLKVLAIRALKSMVQAYGLKRTSEILKLSPVVISRYTNGRTLPKAERAKELLKIFREHYLEDVVRKKLNVSDGVINIADLLHDIQLLDLISFIIFPKYYKSDVDKVLTKEVDGIPLATLISRHLGASLVVAKKRKEPGIERFLEVRQTYESGLYTFIYIPSNHLKQGDNVLIVDDVIRSGSTIRALVKAVRDRKARIAGIFTIVALSSGIKSLEGEGLHVDAIVRI